MRPTRARHDRVDGFAGSRIFFRPVYLLSDHASFLPLPLPVSCVCARACGCFSEGRAIGPGGATRRLGVSRGGADITIEGRRGQQYLMRQGGERISSGKSSILNGVEVGKEVSERELVYVVGCVPTLSMKSGCACRLPFAAPGICVGVNIFFAHGNLCWICAVSRLAYARVFSGYTP